MSKKKFMLPNAVDSSDKKFTVINNRKFSFKRFNKMNMKVSLWNISPPRWPGSPGSILQPKDINGLLKRSFDYTQSGGHLVLWLPLRELHQTEVDLLGDTGGWMAQANIVSGDKSGMNIGYVYSKGPSLLDFDSKVLLDERGRRGPGSSHAMRFLLDDILESPRRGLQYETRRVVEPFMHKSSQMALWTRRRGIRYVGYTSSVKTFDAAKEKLAQVELPGIQMALPAT